MSFTTPLALLALLLLPIFIWLGRPRGSWGRGRAWAAMIVRSLIVVALVLSLAGIQTVRSSDTLAVVFLIDASDSMPEQFVEVARQVTADAIAEMRPEDEAAVVVFGGDALVERPMSPQDDFGPIDSDIITTNTDLAEAIRLSMALFPPGTARRMVIFSDGLANVGDAEEAARLASAAGIEILAYPFELTVGDEILVTDVSIPTRLNPGQVFDLDISIYSAVETAANVRVFGADALLAENAVNLVEGQNRYTYRFEAGDPGLTTYRVQVVPIGEDVYYQNNELSAFTQIVGPPHVLVVTDDLAETANIESALLSQGLTVDRVGSVGFPLDLATLSSYDSVILANVPARELGPRRMELIQTYVRDFGGGLLVIGGPNTYGPGGYFMTPLEETLPIDMQLKDQERLPQLSVLYVIDNSGSMSGQSPSGFTKLDLAKEAIIRSIQLLGPLDRTGVITFDTNAAWVVPLGPATNKSEISNRVGTIRPQGGTDIYAGLLAASEVFPDDPSTLRHIVLLTDGGASEAGIPELVEQMYNDHGITLSVIAITGVGEQYGDFIDDLPPLAGGRFHHITNPDSIPEIFTEETIIATRAYIIEEPFFPTLTASSPILTGIDATPELLGYVGASIKPTATQILATDLDDPLLAAWQYGLGRSVAWTSDSSGRWAQNWLTWDQYARFWSQAVRWTITEGVNQNVEVRVQQEGEVMRITVDAVDTSGDFLNDLDMTASIIAPDLSATPITLNQVAPGQYETTYTGQGEGAYFVTVAGAESGAAASSDAPLAVAQTSGWVMSYSPEYATLDADPAYLEYIAGVTGGSLVTDTRPMLAHTLDAEAATRPLWPFLLLFATILLPFDIAIRRLIITRSDWQQLRDRLRRRQPEPVMVGSSRAASLLNAKQRVAEQEQRRYTAPTGQPSTPPPSQPSDAPSAPSQPSQPAKPAAPRREESASTAPRSTASSLLAAKRKRESPDDGG